MDVPTEPPFVAPIDRTALSRPRFRKDQLHFEVIPEPYIGSPQTAKILLLALNPGFVPEDARNLESEQFRRSARANLTHDAEVPFYYFADGLEWTGGFRWWQAYVGKFFQAEGVTRDQLARGIMSVEVFPYHSVSYHHNHDYLPSQRYSFQVVRTAMAAGKQIVIMRAVRRWLEAVPELAGYPYLTLSNVQRVYVTRKTIDEPNGSGTFDRLVRLLAT